LNRAIQRLHPRRIAKRIQRAIAPTSPPSAERVRLFVPPGHYYSPIVDPDQVRGLVFPDQSVAQAAPAGVDIDDAAMLAFWRSSKAELAEIDIPPTATPGRRYYYQCGYYPIADAVTLTLMLRRFAPRRIIEIGSGYSSALMLDVIDRHLRRKTDLTCIEPDAGRLHSLIDDSDRARVSILETQLQRVDPTLFDVLQENDVLFVDSSHVCKTGSDVHRILFTILPRLKTGVLIHFHDVFYPFEYISPWVLEKNISWNEAYLLHAFLMYNTAFRIVFFNDYFWRRHRAEIERDCPNFMINTGGALWLRKER
jgi:hypothetical protein